MKLKSSKLNLVLVATVYLLGIFMGALDTGIITPARTVIQNSLMVDEQTGIWMITIYTLAYAASIPIMGKLADKRGRKNVYLISVLLFGLGSLFCGLAQDFASFELLIVARALQAIGGGGILPVATAEFGTAFPEEKRGMALGLVGGVYGIANIFGASAGSLILDVFGSSNWQFIFYVNLPITAFILLAGFLVLPNTKEKDVKPIDGLGIVVLTIMILGLLYGLKNIDYFDLQATLTSVDVYPFMIAFFVLIPVFILVERKAKDPVMNLAYFSNSRIVITLVLSIVTGVVMMGMIFIPQFAENAMKLPSGSGGYFVMILALFAGIGAPVSGKFIDKFGVKVVLGFGLVASIAGALYLMFVTTSNPNMFNVVVSLILIGVGMGFTMGTPLNYMMLANTRPEESNSALATLSLVRSIGTAIAPAIMVGFLAHAGTTVQENIMGLLPDEVQVPPLVHAQELTDEFNTYKADPDTAELFATMDIPDLMSMQTVEIDMDASSDLVVSDDLLEMMKGSDVTTIVGNTKQFAVAMFAQMTPDVMVDIEDGIDSGINGINDARAQMDKSRFDMEEGYNGIGDGIAGMTAAITAQQEALSQLYAVLPMMQKMSASGTSGSVADMIPDSVKASIPQTVLDELAQIRSAEELKAKIAQIETAKRSMLDQIAQMRVAQSGIDQGIIVMEASLLTERGKLSDLEAELAAAGGDGGGSGDDPSGDGAAPSEGGATSEDAEVIAEIQARIAAQKLTIAQLESELAAAKEQLASLLSGIDGLTAAVSGQETALARMQSILQNMSNVASYSSILDLMPANVKNSLPQSVLTELSSVRTVSD
ncbi:MAG: MFS transporter, partial [Coriobacteriaceae bacterium]|nr:MFS transporter [Coriobacteriaceae bacterium]